MVSHQLGRLLRIDTRRAPPIGQQHDRRRFERPGRHRHELLLGFLLAGRLVQALAAFAAAAVDHRAEVDVFVGKQLLQRHHQAAAHSGAALHLEPVDGSHQVLAVQCGGLHQLCRAGKGDDRHADVLGQLLEESLGCVLCGYQPVGLDVVGAHAERHIHGQHDRGVVGRQRDHRQRTRGCQQHQGQRQQKQRRRHMPAPPHAGPHGLLHDRQAGVTQRQLLPAPQQPRIDQHQQRYCQQQPQKLWPEECHRHVVAPAEWASRPDRPNRMPPPARGNRHD